MSRENRDCERFDIVIAGASFAGLALACGLTQALGSGFRIALIDRAAAPADRPQDRRAFAIWAGARRAIEALGAWDAIAPSAEPMTAIEISDSALEDSVRPSRLSYDAVTDDGQPVAHMVPAAELHRCLYANLADHGNITWLVPGEVEAIETDAHAISLKLAGKTVKADLCVAADGRNSKLRDWAGIKTVGWRYDQSGIVATVKFSEPHGGVAIQHFLPGGPFAVLPLRDDRACITWSAATKDATRLAALSDVEFLRELDQRIGGRFGEISLDGPRQVWPLDVRLPRSLIATRLALIGDAAHGVHPIAGQGVNLAFRDAAALAEIIADAARIGVDIGSGVHLERYQRWRRFDATMSASLYDGLNRLFSFDSTMLRAGRGVGLALLDRIPEAKRLILSEAAGLTGDLPKLMRGEAV